MQMPYRRLGASGLKVSPLCLGTMTFGETTTAADAGSIIAHAADIGVNFIDTADAYVDGESERIVGAAIRSARSRWILATKAGNVLTKVPFDGGSSRRWLLQACDESLRRLGTDYIDIFYLHKEDYETSFEETVDTLGRLMESGKIRYFGVSNFRGWRIAEIVNVCKRAGVPLPVISQPYYNLLNRMPEVEVLPACEYHGLGVAAYSPIARGVLTGKYAPGAAPEADSRAGRKNGRFMETEFREESLAIAQRLREHAHATGRTLMAFALAWLWANRIVTCALAGPRTMAQWQTYVDAIGTPWTAEDEALVDGLVPLGHPSTPGYSDPAYPVRGRPLR
jgi:aryl-alcohol dehydrogenase-like predicted oxidoreductase